MSVKKPGHRQSKIAHESGFIGQDGINFIATVVGRMRHLWTPTSGQSDVGIDGYIELCEQAADGKSIPTNFIIQVQSKATDRAWVQEDDDGFILRVDERDLKHWLGGNHKVILIASRPRTKEAYWISVKDYFSTPESKQTRTICFKKVLHRFDEHSNLALRNLAVPQNAGVFMEPIGKNETLESNIVPFTFPETINIGVVRFKKSTDILDLSRKLKISLPREWFYKNSKIMSFLPLERAPWTNFIEGNNLTVISTKSWASSDDPVIARDFVRLLNETLAGFLARRGLWQFRISNQKFVYYFAPNSNCIERKHRWGDKGRERTVVQKVISKKDNQKIVCYRHHAIIPHFERLNGEWYLTIEPTYHFTANGERVYWLREEYLSGIKRLEKNQAVGNNVRFWAHLLSYRSLFENRQELFSFGVPLSFATSFGIPDSEWLSSSDDMERESLLDSLNDNADKTLFIDDDQLCMTYET